jgi:hypothetical protein
MLMVHFVQKHVLKKYFAKAKVVDSTTTLGEKKISR